VSMDCYRREGVGRGIEVGRGVGGRKGGRTSHRAAPGRDHVTAERSYNKKRRRQRYRGFEGPGGKQLRL